MRSYFLLLIIAIGILLIQCNKVVEVAPLARACLEISADTCNLGKCTIIFNATCSESAATYSWDLGDNTMKTGSSTSHEYRSTGTFIVSLTVTNKDGEEDKATGQIVVVPAEAVPNEAIISVSPTDCETPCDVEITNSSTGTITDYAWDFGDGRTGSQTNARFAIKYEESDEYQIILKATGPLNSSSDTAVVTVTDAPPKPLFTVNPQDCQVPCDVTITNSSSGLIDSYKWDFGDGNTGTDSALQFLYTYQQPGTFTIQLEVTGPGGTVQADSREVKVDPKPDPPSASFEVDSTVCFIPCDLQITNTSTGVISQYSWDFGDNTFGDQDETTFFHRYDEVGRYTIKLTANGPGGSSTADPIIVEVKEPVYSLVPVDWDIDQDVPPRGTETLQVKVQNQFAEPIPGIGLDFSILLGNSSINPTAITGSDGIANVPWTFGVDFEKHEISVAISPGESITANPITISADANLIVDNLGYRYPTILIANQRVTTLNLCLDSNMPCQPEGSQEFFELDPDHCAMAFGDGWRYPGKADWEGIMNSASFIDLVSDGELGLNIIQTSDSVLFHSRSTNRQASFNFSTQSAQVISIQSSTSPAYIRCSIRL